MGKLEEKLLVSATRGIALQLNRIIILLSNVRRIKGEFARYVPLGLLANQMLCTN